MCSNSFSACSRLSKWTLIGRISFGSLSTTYHRGAFMPQLWHRPRKCGKEMRGQTGLTPLLAEKNGVEKLGTDGTFPSFSATTCPYSIPTLVLVDTFVQ